MVGFLMGGCSLNIPLEDQFSDPDAITDVLSARSLLASAYEGLPQHLFEYSVLSDDFCPTQYLDRDATLKNLYDWREVEMTELAGTLWTEYYMVVAEVNALLARMDGVITLNDAEVEEKERIICEAKGLKAWCYFNLLRLFAPRYEGNEAKDGIILKDRVELDFLPRSSMKVCVEEIRKLLKEARNEKNTLKNVHWLSDKSIAYLQVELELYAGNYPAVLEQTESLETVYPETVLGAGAYETLWSGSDSEARIFAKYQLAQIYEEIRFETFDKGDYLVLTDIQGLEDFFGDMDFKVTGTKEGITAIQMDIKIHGLTRPIVEEAIARTREARLFIMDECMSKAISEPRKEISKYAPKIVQIQIDPAKIGDVVGQRGKTINEIIDRTGVKIDITDDGAVSVCGTDPAAMDQAVEMIKIITTDFEEGQIFKGKIVSIKEFGAFVEFAPGKEGMIHISKISKERINRVEDVLTLGDKVTVVCLGKDKMGRISFSMKDVARYTK